MRQNFGSIDASRLVNNIHLQPLSLDHYINDDNNDGDDILHPIKLGPSDGQGHKTPPTRDIPRVIL